MIQRSLDPDFTNEPNDLLAIKAHYVKTLIDEILKKDTDDVEKICDELSKKFAHGNEKDGFKMFEEKISSRKYS